MGERVILEMWIYAYILSMMKDRVRAGSWYSFFVRVTTPSMDRDWRGSTPPPSRYHTAIGRARPDPEEDPEDPHTRSLTHRLPHPRDLHFRRSKMADGFYSTGHSLYIG